MRRLVPNLISLARLLACIPYFFWLVEDPFSYKVITLAVAIVLSDKLDGYLARRYKATSKLGEVIDSFADSVFIVGTWILLYAFSQLPTIIFIGLLLPRAITLVSSIIYYVIHRRWSAVHIQANRIAAVIQFVLILCIMVQVPGITYITYTGILTAALFVLYGEYKRHAKSS